VVVVDVVVDVLWMELKVPAMKRRRFEIDRQRRIQQQQQLSSSRNTTTTSTSSRMSYLSLQMSVWISHKLAIPHDIAGE
jgi:hypothetical protein